MEYNAKRITTFNQLINLLQVAEKHDTIMMNNNSRPVETKKVPEANYGKSAKSGRNPNAKGKLMDDLIHTIVQTRKVIVTRL